MSDDEIRLKAEKVVSQYTKGTAVVGLLPLPLIDTVAVAAAQIAMLRGIAKAYGVAFSENAARMVISALLGSVVPLSLRSVLVSLFKGNPLLATVTGSVAMAVFSGSATYAMGKVFILHFESGGTLLDFDADKMRDYYQQQLKTAKDKIKTVSNSYAGIKP